MGDWIHGGGDSDNEFSISLTSVCNRLPPTLALEEVVGVITKCVKWCFPRDVYSSYCCMVHFSVT